MSEESDLERSEAPSPRRLEQAREEGQVARSPELSALAILMAGAGGLWFSGAQMFRGMEDLMTRAMRVEAVAADPQLMLDALSGQAMGAWMLAAPFFIVLMLVGLAAPMAMSGWLFTFKPVEPNFSKLNPLKGLARMFSGHALAELGKALAKAGVIGCVAALVIWSQVDEFTALLTLPLESGISRMGRIVVWSLAAVAAGMVLIVAIDVPLQLWRHTSKLRMTKEDVRKEMKESEGDPHIKAAIRQQQREMAKRRMMAGVPKADVVVTNPTHYAVALSYAEGGMRAPRVVAKGSDLVAARIREIAAEHRVPVLESPPLARALFRHTEIGEEIPEALFTAVAEILAYVFQLRHYRSHGGAAPKPPGEIAVPPGLDPAGGAA
ncbi:MAG: flagellar type III secretion system protein FlhB [Burkholderiales bacterium]|nr:flagellar type III secretion system protein FlhB [Burkholderiales bacterium]